MDILYTVCCLTKLVKERPSSPATARIYSILILTSTTYLLENVNKKIISESLNHNVVSPVCLTSSSAVSILLSAS